MTCRRVLWIAASAALLAGCGEEKVAGQKAAALRKQTATASAPSTSTPAPTPAPTSSDPPLPPPPPKHGGAKPGAPVPAKLADILCDLAKWDAASKEDRRAAAKEAARRAPGFELLRVEEFSCGGLSHEIGVFKHAKTETEFVLVPGGAFEMGSPDNEEGRQVFENLHAVTLTHPFLLARTECTQATWKRVMATDPSKAKGDDRPVEMASWEDVQSFCEKTGLSLPTEAQWERACRAGTMTRFFHGDDVAGLADVAWYATRDIDPKDIESHPVAQKLPNAFGIYDMLGNVNEWCADMMAPHPTAAVTDPFTAIDQAHKSPVFRGGSFRRPETASRAAYRLSLDADAHDSTIGFRPAKTLTLE